MSNAAALIVDDDRHGLLPVVIGIRRQLMLHTYPRRVQEPGPLSKMASLQESSRT